MRRFSALWLDLPSPLRLVPFMLVLVLLAMCSGCATKPVTVTVRVPVPVACQEPIPDQPAMPTDSLTVADDLDRKTAAALAEIEVRRGYEGQLLAGLVACTKPLKGP